MEKNILIIADLDSGLIRSAIRGASQFARQQKDWDVRLLHSGTDMHSREMEHLSEWKPDGVLELLCRRTTPHPVFTHVVSVQAGIWDPVEGQKDIGIDEPAVGALAAEYLIDQGAEQLAFLALHANGWTEERQAAFTATAERSEKSCLSVISSSGTIGSGEIEWLRSLPPRTGLFIPQDRQAVEILRELRILSIDVPGTIALLSVDNDDLICGLSHPPLSSITLPMFTMGYQSALLLSCRMAGTMNAQLPILLPPVRVHPRQSTTLLAVTDPDVAAACSFITKNFQSPINVDDIISHVGISRSALQRKFRSVLGRTPLEEIHRVRIEGVREMLLETDKSVQDIAELFSFRDPTAMSMAFKQFYGCAPGRYRGRYRMQV